MRIISGKYKGRVIEKSSKITARPTTDFAKEALFNILAHQIELDDTLVLDLFAGTGSIGLEFVSRGCKSAISVEKERNHCLYIQQACKVLKIDNLSVLQTDAFRFMTTTKLQFDIIFADPPYQLVEIPTIPDLIFQNQLLNPDGLFILEHSDKHDFQSHAHFREMRQYSSVHFSFFSEVPD